MTDASDIRIDLVPDSSVVRPGSILEGTIRVHREAMGTLELSVGWYTEGRGSTDSGTTYFETLDPESAEREGDWLHFPLRARMPMLPLTYYGTLLKIHWRVRARVLTVIGRDVAIDRPIEVRL